MCREGEILPVELELFIPSEPLPGRGVREGGEPELLVLQLLGDGEPLSGSKVQPREVTEVCLGHALEQPPPSVGTQPLCGSLIPGEGGGGRGGCAVSSLEGSNGS